MYFLDKKCFLSSIEAIDSVESCVHARSNNVTLIDVSEEFTQATFSSPKVLILVRVMQMFSVVNILRQMFCLSSYVPGHGIGA